MILQDAYGFRIVTQDPIEAAAWSIPAACMAAPPKEPLGREDVPMTLVGKTSHRGSTVAQRACGSGSSLYGGLPDPGHQRFSSPRASPVASPVTSATTALSSGAGHATPVVGTVATVTTENRFPLAFPMAD